MTRAMSDTEIVQQSIEKIRNTIKSGFTKFLVSPILESTDKIRIEYDDIGKRKLYVRDLSSWKEHKYIDASYEGILSGSGYPVLQSVSKPMLKNVIVECSTIRTRPIPTVVATSCVFSKFKSLDQISYPETLMMLPDHCLSMFPFFVSIDLAKKKPAEAKEVLLSCLSRIGGILEQTEATKMLKGSKEAVIGKISRNYPRIDRSLIVGINFIIVKD